MTLWVVAHQALLSMGLSRQEYWSGLSFPPPDDLPNPGIEPRSPALQVDSLSSKYLYSKYYLKVTAKAYQHLGAISKRTNNLSLFPR